jgi:hypothetical protein
MDLTVGGSVRFIPLKVKIKIHVCMRRAPQDEPAAMVQRVERTALRTLSGKWSWPAAVVPRPTDSA